tara:strand:+ start:20737 stop:21321 length:585 start_codon:yes stop_codon:yes gene_type:complete
MSNLENVTPADSYPDLFRLVNGGAGLDATLRNITGGDGTPTGIFISSTVVQADMNDGVLRRPLMRDARKLYLNLGDVSTIDGGSGTVDLDLEAADVFRVGVDQNLTTLNLDNAVAGVDATDGRMKEILLVLDQKGTSGGGYFTVSWPSSINWDASALPVLSEVDNSTDVFRLIYLNDGSDLWFGEIVGQNMGTP